MRAVTDDTKLPRWCDLSAIFTEYVELARRCALRAIQIPPRRKENNDSSRKPLLRGVVDASLWLASSARTNWDRREMAEDEEADCSNNARLFQIAVSNILKNIAESVRWATLACTTARFLLSSRATSRVYLNLFYPLSFARFFFPLETDSLN